MGDYPLYSAETSDIRRGEAESDIILARLNNSDIRPLPRPITYLSDPYALNFITKIREEIYSVTNVISTVDFI